MSVVAQEGLVIDKQGRLGQLFGQPDAMFTQDCEQRWEGDAMQLLDH
jgi:hypothetical protein